jgi:hypothetical protein
MYGYLFDPTSPLSNPRIMHAMASCSKSKSVKLSLLLTSLRHGKAYALVNSMATCSKCIQCEV